MIGMILGAIYTACAVNDAMSRDAPVKNQRISGEPEETPQAFLIWINDMSMEKAQELYEKCIINRPIPYPPPDLVKRALEEKLEHGKLVSKEFTKIMKYGFF